MEKLTVLDKIDTKLHGSIPFEKKVSQSIKKFLASTFETSSFYKRIGNLVNLNDVNLSSFLETNRLINGKKVTLQEDIKSLYRYLFLIKKRTIEGHKITPQNYNRLFECVDRICDTIIELKPEVMQVNYESEWITKIVNTKLDLTKVDKTKKRLRAQSVLKDKNYYQNAKKTSDQIKLYTSIFRTIFQDIISISPNFNKINDAEFVNQNNWAKLVNNIIKISNTTFDPENYGKINSAMGDWSEKSYTYQEYVFAGFYLTGNKNTKNTIISPCGRFSIKIRSELSDLMALHTSEVYSLYPVNEHFHIEVTLTELGKSQFSEAIRPRINAHIEIKGEGEKEPEIKLKKGVDISALENLNRIKTIDSNENINYINNPNPNELVELLYWMGQNNFSKDDIKDTAEKFLKYLDNKIENSSKIRFEKGYFDLCVILLNNNFDNFFVNPTGITDKQAQIELKRMNWRN